MKKRINSRCVIILLILSCLFYSANAQIPTETDEKSQGQMATELFSKGDFAGALEIYYKMIEENPTSPKNVWLQSNIIITNLLLKKISTASKEVGVLLNDYADDPNLVGALFVTADFFDSRSLHVDKARDIYYLALERAVDEKEIFRITKGLVTSWIRLNRYRKAQEYLDQLLEDYAGNEQLAFGINNIADLYYERDERDRAVELYNYVIENFPQTRHALWAQAGLVICHIDHGMSNRATTDEAIEILKQNYSEQPGFHQALLRIADKFRARSTRPVQTLELYELCLEGISEPQKIWSRLGIVISTIRILEIETAKSLTEQMLIDYSDHPELPYIIRSIADAYRQLSQYESAINLYDYVISTWPGHNQALWSQGGIARININLSNDDQVRQIIDVLIAEHKDNPVTYDVVFAIGGEYWDLARLTRIENTLEDTLETGKKFIINDISRYYYSQALITWERIISELPKTIKSANAYYYAASCCKYVESGMKKLEYFQTLINSWPDNKYVPHAFIMMARNYLGVLEDEDRGIPAEDLNAEIKKAYEFLAFNYPDFAATSSAVSWLEDYSKRTDPSEQEPVTTSIRLAMTGLPRDTFTDLSFRCTDDPVAVIDGPENQYYAVGSTITYNAGASYDPDGGCIIYYAWKLLNKTTGEWVIGPCGLNASRWEMKMDEPGVFKICLYVLDDDYENNYAYFE